MDKSLERDEKVLRDDWEKVGNFISMALHDVAVELGGEGLAERVGEAAFSSGVLPNPTALKMLEELHPGSADQVLTRASKLQSETHQKESAKFRKSKIRTYGKALIDGFNGIGNIITQRK